MVRIGRLKGINKYLKVATIGVVKCDKGKKIQLKFWENECIINYLKWMFSLHVAYTKVMTIVSSIFATVYGKLESSMDNCCEQENHLDSRTHPYSTDVCAKWRLIIKRLPYEEILQSHCQHNDIETERGVAISSRSECLFDIVFRWRWGGCKKICRLSVKQSSLGWRQIQSIKNHIYREREGGWENLPRPFHPTRSTLLTVSRELELLIPTNSAHCVCVSLPSVTLHIYISHAFIVLLLQLYMKGVPTVHAFTGG